MRARSFDSCRRVRSVFGSNEGWRHVDIDGWTDGRTGDPPRKKRKVFPLPFKFTCSVEAVIIMWEG